MALVTDYTDPAYDAYATLVEMDTAMGKVGLVRNVSFWSGLSDDQKEGLICLASDEIGRYGWKGTLNAAVIAPDMFWPRSGVTHRNNVALPDNVVPQEIIRYMGCWISGNYLQAAGSAGSGGSEITAGAVKSKKVGDVSVSYETNADIIAAQTSALNASASGGTNDPCLSYVTWFLSSTASVAGIGVVRK